MVHIPAPGPGPRSGLRLQFLPRRRADHPMYPIAATPLDAKASLRSSRPRSNLVSRMQHGPSNLSAPPSKHLLPSASSTVHGKMPYRDRPWNNNHSTSHSPTSTKLNRSTYGSASGPRTESFSKSASSPDWPEKAFQKHFYELDSSQHARKHSFPWTSADISPSAHLDNSDSDLAKTVPLSVNSVEGGTKFGPGSIGRPYTIATRQTPVATAAPLGLEPSGIESNTVRDVNNRPHPQPSFAASNFTKVPSVLNGSDVMSLHKQEDRVASQLRPTISRPPGILSHAASPVDQMLSGRV